MSYEDKLCEAIEYIVEDKVKNAGYDKTIQATIIELVDSTIGKYKVKYQDSSFYAFATNSKTNFAKGKLVYVLVHNNDMNQEKTILGAVDKLGLDYSYNPPDEDVYIQIGTNAIDNSTNQYDLKSYFYDDINETEEQVIILYDKNDTDHRKIQLINKKEIEEYMKQSSSLKIGCDIQTRLDFIQSNSNGQYGIICDLIFKDKSNPDDQYKYIKRTYKFDTLSMTGQPLKYPSNSWTNQSNYYEIDGENFVEIDKISIFKKGFPKTNNSKPSDIFIKNIEIAGCNILELIDNPNRVSIRALEGTVFSSEWNTSDTKNLKATVYIDGKRLTNTNDVKFYWFTEDVRISQYQLSEYYNNLAGDGWKCLNNKNKINNETMEWVAATDTWQVKKKDVLAKKVKYKCIALYNELVMTDEIYIVNEDSNYIISIESDSGTEFYFDVGTPSLTCKANNKAGDNSGYEYYWAVRDNKNNFTFLPNTTNENKEYNEAKNKYNEIQNKLDNNTILKTQGQEELATQLTIMENYDTIRRVEDEHIWKIQINQIDKFNTYSCSVYQNGQFVGTADIIISNILEQKPGYTLVINNGIRVFKYDEKGISPYVDSLEKPIPIQPLTFSLFDNKGNDITNKVEIKDIEWTIPKKNTMLVKTFKATEETEDSYIYKDDNELNYQISTRYNINALNNTIYLRINYQGLNLYAHTNLTFTKEGEPGTNGTEFVAIIVPNTNNDLEDYPMIVNGNPNYIVAEGNRNKWFKVQLWHNGEIIYSGTEDGTTTENKKIQVSWKILANKYGTERDFSDYRIDEKTGVFTIINNNFEHPANIVQCLVKYDKINYYATLPIITANINDANTQIKLKKDTGFRFVLYTTDGRRPQYDNTYPFEIKVIKEIKGREEDVSELVEPVNLSYHYDTKGRIYTNNQWNDNSRYDLTISKEAKNKVVLKPSDTSDGECVNHALVCTVVDNGRTVGIIHIPIHFLLNRFGQAAINDWDGNSVQINEEGGFILAPQMGAGEKDSNNRFTGVLMGKVHEAGKTHPDIGLLGYNEGIRSFFVNSKDGSAILGKQGNGQIILDPNTNKAYIYSNNFWKNYNEDGLPTNYNSGNEKGQGMLIDLTTPSIRFGSGDFSVDQNGYLHSKGGGDIAGWQISDTRLSKGNVYISSSGDYAFYANGNSYIKHDGYLFSKSGQIAGWDISSDRLSKNGVYMASGSGTTHAFDANGKFWADHNGKIHAESGDIGGWQLSFNTIKGGNVTLNSNGDIVCTGGQGWYIKSDGSASFAGGKLKIESNGNLTIKTDGISFDAGQITQEINNLKSQVINIEQAVNDNSSDTNASTVKYVKDKSTAAQNNAIAASKTYTNDEIEKVKQDINDRWDTFSNGPFAEALSRIAALESKLSKGATGGPAEISGADFAPIIGGGQPQPKTKWHIKVEDGIVTSIYST